MSPSIEVDFRSAVVDWMRSHGHRFENGETRLLLAREFGFCYGVDRAVEYAYDARARFPDRRIFITGEIIHNPWVNRRLAELGVRRIPAEAEGEDRFASLEATDVVLIPAFGTDQEAMRRLRSIGCILIDTTCGSVLNVWKNVGRYARDGYTSIIHGKFDHEETLATCSQVRERGGAFLVVRDLDEARIVARFIETGEHPDDLARRFARAVSPGFDPTRDLDRIGLANQTTMLSSESIGIAEALREAMTRRHGAVSLPERYRSFDTICSATQDRQDAVEDLLLEPIDRLVVVGGFNSSNTGHLVEIAEPRVPTFHIERAADLISPRWIRHKPSADPQPVMTGGWVPDGPVTFGVTAGASTPNREIGRTILRLLLLRGVPEEALAPLMASEGMG